MGWERGQIMPVELPDHKEDTSPTLSFASSSLAELLAQAREALLAYGVRHETQRGATRSLNGVALTWTDPEHDTTDGLEWSADQIAWYLRVFVEKRPENNPARLSKDGALASPTPTLRVHATGTAAGATSPRCWRRSVLRG